MVIPSLSTLESADGSQNIAFAGVSSLLFRFQGSNALIEFDAKFGARGHSNFGDLMLGDDLELCCLTFPFKSEAQ